MKKIILITVFASTLLFVANYVFFYDFLLQKSSVFTGYNIVSTSVHRDMFDKFSTSISLTLCIPIALGITKLQQKLLKVRQETLLLLVHSSFAIIAWMIGVGIRLCVLTNELQLLKEAYANTLTETSLTIPSYMLNYASWGFGAIIILCCVIFGILLLAQKNKLTNIYSQLLH
jgi:hypothetical protein